MSDAMALWTDGTGHIKVLAGDICPLVYIDGEFHEALSLYGPGDRKSLSHVARCIKWGSYGLNRRDYVRTV